MLEMVKNVLSLSISAVAGLILLLIRSARSGVGDGAVLVVVAVMMIIGLIALAWLINFLRKT